MTGIENGTTLSAFLDGRLQLSQPAKGHRVGTDAALLSACLAPAAGEVVYDLGAGIGAAGLGLAVRCPQCRVALVEIDPAIAGLAATNAARNGLGERVNTIEADVTQRPAKGQLLVPGTADHVMMNPPFHLPGTVRPAPDAYRAGAHVHGEDTEEAWILCALGLLRARGTLALIHRVDALPRLLASLDRRFGDIRVKPVQPRAGTPATRLLIRAVKGSRAPFLLLPPLILHGDDAGFTPEADALHRGETPIDWQDHPPPR
ncbi:tRNA1(Val) (adenine(37)-N6)-methyltransferase [Labrys sp. WJW]|uniref:tRNA1(Val) (adenine(37)-N6)-methyltransferase n=1 Tax=Labrys sp. WJW TaxID=1737983 RepID=UPI001FD8F562|nr:methyltransferase [Labrys sp. WJW]